MKTEAGHLLAGVRVLVVEDVAAVREVICGLLETRGATVVEAATAREALGLVQTHEFDVVLTDLGLPDMSGEAVIAGVRAATGERTPVAVVSGADAPILARAIEVGAEQVFKKPIDREGLIRYLAGKVKVATLEDMPEPRTKTDVTVLIIEDDGEMRALLREVLEGAGYRVIGRQDGTALPALVERERFDVAIVDKELPGPNGLDLLSFLRQRLPAVPVILVTAFGGSAIKHEAARRGAYSYVEKPFRVSAILDMLATVSTPLRGEEPGNPA